MGPKNLLAAAHAMPIPAAGPHWLGWALRRNGEDEPRWRDIDTIVRAASTKPAADASVYIWDVSCKLAAQGSSFNPQDCWDSLIAAINKIFDAVTDSAPRCVHESSTTNTVAPACIALCTRAGFSERGIASTFVTSRGAAHVRRLACTQPHVPSGPNYFSALAQ